MNDESIATILPRLDFNYWCQNAKDRNYAIIKHKTKSPVFRQVLEDDFDYLKPLNLDSEKYKMKILTKAINITVLIQANDY